MSSSNSMLRLTFKIFVLICVMFVESKQKAKEFRSDYTYVEDADGWFKLHRIPAVWHEAHLRCQFEGSVLASPINQEVTNALKNFIKQKQVNSCGVFTGTHATFSNGDFFSVEGVPLSSMPVDWVPDEPNNFNNSEKCIAFTENATIADTNCDDVLPYVCYKKRTKGMVVNGCGTTDSEYTLSPVTGNCYKFHRVARTWSRAFMVCAAEGGYLAIPNSEEEAKVLKELFEKNPARLILQVHTGMMRDIMHIGFNDWGERGDWHTIQGQSLQEAGFSKFSGGQPDNFTAGEFCGGMFRNGLLDDLWCYEIGPFICEKSPDSLTDN